jgi:tetratricopeptide (TPR) repeat protein
MLFDLKGKRKRVVQVTYVGLAILFAGGLVLFGVGGNVSGGLIDAFRGGGGGADNSVFEDNAEAAERRAVRNPQSAEAWLDVVRTKFNVATSTVGSDPETGALTDKGQQAIVEVVQAWERYLKLDPKKIDSNGATSAALAYGALQDYDKAIRAQELSVKSRPSANGYFQLADLAYRGDQVKKGDAASREAVRRTPADLRNNVRAQIEELKRQGRQIARALAEAEKAEREAGKETEPGQSFGPLPGQGAEAGGSSP